MAKKVTLISILTILLVTLGSIFLYNSATKPLEDGKNEAIKRAKEEVNLTKVTNIDWFHYTDSYYVIEGVTADNKEIYVWVPEDKNGTVHVENKKAGMSKDKVKAFVFNELNDISRDKRPKEIMKIKLGMIEEAPAYEITYRDQENRYSILYIDYFNGDWYRVYNL
ncbi:cell wall elongation regulator TseB-like domain-containing protein [Bacillus andreraoultii]|uniref:cell wall elongation regulator TseB-like domain-containing protein n=1 Tax=Bacillus andreraoultii TaxID=1499685 RepID=UPI00053B7DDB|nr:DUF5590 domain-containing protein [Bacillus andreraoultii]